MFHGISLHLTPWSQAIVNGIVKYAYPPNGQHDTTVVLFREENLAELAESFPVSYARHAEVLEALSVYAPRAVFVDFAFIDARSPEDQAALGRAICDLNARGKVPVYLAAPAPSSGRDQGAPINARLLECAEPVNAQMDVERGVSGVLTYLARQRDLRVPVDARLRDVRRARAPRGAPASPARRTPSRWRSSGATWARS